MKNRGIGVLLLLFASVAALAQVPTIDVVKTHDQSGASSSITTSSITTNAAPELLLAFISTDGPSGGTNQIMSVATTGLTWHFVARSNIQAGDAEVWEAVSPNKLSLASVAARLSSAAAASMTVVSITGVNQTTPIGAINSNSAPSGAPNVTLNTVGTNSLLFAVGNDWDNAIGRTVDSGQSLVHQYLASVGDTYWVQRLNSNTTAAGTFLLGDTSPTGDQYNFVGVEVLAGSSAPAPTYSISGVLNPSSLTAGSTVTLTQNGTNVTAGNADQNGNFSFSNLQNGTYTVTPSKTGLTFNPTSQTVTVNGASVTTAAFTASQVQTSGIKLLQDNVNGNEAGGFLSMSVSFKTNTTPGASIIATGTCVRPAGHLTISDTLGNNFELIAGPMSNPGQDANAYLWRVRSGLGGPDTITISTPDGGCAMETHISEWQGLDPNVLFDQTTFAQGSSGTSFSSGTVVTLYNGELVLGYCFPIGNSTVGSGFTLLTYVNGDADEYLIQPSAGSIAATYTQDSNGTWFATVATIKAAQ